MSKKVFGKWLNRDTRKTKNVFFEDIGIELTLEGLLYSEHKNLLKEHTIDLPNGETKFEDDEYQTKFIAKTIKAADGEPIDLTSKEDLEEIGVKTTKEALDKLFTMGEITKLTVIAQELAGLDKTKEHK